MSDQNRKDTSTSYRVRKRRMTDRYFRVAWFFFAVVLIATSVGILSTYTSVGAHPPPQGETPPHDHTLRVRVTGEGEGRVTSAAAWGIDCRKDNTGTCTADIPANWTNDIVLTASPTGGSTFSGWSGNCGGSGTCRVTVDQARVNQDNWNVIATFASPPQSLTITPTSGTPRITTVTVRGSNYSPGVSHAISFGNTAQVGQVRADQNGSFNYTFQIPWAPQGPHTVRVDQSVAVFTVVPGLTLSPTSGPAGSIAQIEGDGFPANQGNIRFQFGPQTRDPVTADPEGSIRTSFQVPDLAAGSYQVRVGSAPPVNFTITDGVQILLHATVVGTAMIDGESAPDDTLIVAAVGDVKVGSAMTTGGIFSILIPPAVADSNRGPVDFLVGSVLAEPNMEVMLAPGVEARGIALRAYSSPMLTQSLIISPAIGSPRETILTVSGRYYTPDAYYPVIFGEVGQVEGVRANQYGNFKVFTTVPAVPQGLHTVRVGRGEAVFTVIPGFRLSQDAASVGSIVQIDGVGFSASQNNIRFQFGTLTLSPVISDSNGSVRWSFEVPNLPPGSYQVRVGSAAPVIFNVVGGIPITGTPTRCYTGVVTKEEVLAVIGMYFAGQPGQIPTPTPTPTPKAETGTFVAAEGSEITFTVGHVLARFPARIEAVMRSTAISGQINIGGEPSTIQVDLHTLSSDQRYRDQYVRSRMFPNDPIASFTVDSVGGLPPEFHSGDTFERQASGTLSLKGKDFPLTFDLEVRNDGNVLNVLGRTIVTWEQLEIPVPKARSVVSIEDDIHVQILLVATESTPMPIQTPTPTPSP